MKKNHLVLVSLAFIFNMFSANAQFIKEGASIKFNEEASKTWIVKGKMGQSRVFEFINDGTEPLVIKSIKNSKGFKVKSYPQKPILPGKSGSIELICEMNKVGSFNRKVAIITNSKNGPDKNNPGTTVLLIKGKVISH